MHARWLQIQKELYSNQRPRELQRLDDTRWSCRYAACKTIRDRLQAVLQLLAELSSGDNAHRAVEARCLLKAIDSHFVVTLILMCDIFGRTNAFCCMMQSSTLDLSRAVELIDATYDELVENRATDVHFDKVWDDGVDLCQVCNMELNTSTPVVSEQSSSSSSSTVTYSAPPTIDRWRITKSHKNV